MKLNAIHAILHCWIDADGLLSLYVAISS